MNRNILKIIAVISMVIDHIGAYLLPSYFWMRWIGRLAFPIFAFFIAEGLKYTKNRKKYVLTLFIFAIISQVPNALLTSWYDLNILFTFLISILIIYLVETFNKLEVLKLISLIIISVTLIICDLYGIVDYGIFGVLLVVVFYFIKDRKISLIIGGVCLILITLRNMLFDQFTVQSMCQITSVLAIALLFSYNGQRGRVNLKWLFYIFYPAHLVVIYIIQVLI